MQSADAKLQTNQNFGGSKDHLHTHQTFWTFLMEPTPDASSLSYTSQSSSPSLPDEVFLDLLGHILGDIQEGPSKS